MNRLQTEAMLAAEIIGWLELEGWETYSEVTSPSGQERADIVAVRTLPSGEKNVAVIECKRELTFELLAQAKKWKGTCQTRGVRGALGGRLRVRAAGAELAVARRLVDDDHPFDLLLDRVVAELGVGPASAGEGNR